MSCSQFSLNNIVHANEKMGPNPGNAKRISEFYCMIKDCGLFDLGYNGPACTWTNKRFNTNPTYERLDRFLANAEWCTTYPTTSVYRLPMMKSDHAPILALLESSRPKIKKPFRFENWWLLENDFQKIAKQRWRKSNFRPFHKKNLLSCCWPQSLEKIKAQNFWPASSHRRRPPSATKETASWTEPKHLERACIPTPHYLTQTRNFPPAKIQKNWCISGDRNTSFFHQAILKRARRNCITHLQNPNGTVSTTPQQLAETVNQWFTEIFTSQAPNNADQNHDEEQHQIGGDRQVPTTDAYTNSVPDLQELHTIVKNMRNNAAPGPDGLNAAFYKASWSWVSSDVHNLVSSFYQNGRLCPKINSTYS